MSKIDFVEKMVTLGVRYKPGFFPNGAWRQHGSILSAYVGNVLVGQFDSATGEGFVSRGKQTGACGDWGGRPRQW